MLETLVYLALLWK